MPASARKSIVDLSFTRTYHCVSRCVRRAYLCGRDPHIGKDYDHRKSWLLERLKVAAGIFTVDVCAFSVRANHWHVVLRSDVERADGLSDEAVLRRTSKLWRSTGAAARALSGRSRGDRVDELRARLSDISWMVRFVNEYIARRANREEECTGRFWEGRFHSQALLGDAALVTAMAYVDLNPIRVGDTTRLEDCHFTSIVQRLREAKKTAGESEVVPLAPFVAEARRGSGGALPLRYDQYTDLLAWTAKAARSKGRAPGDTPSALATLEIDRDVWLRTMVKDGLRNLPTIGDNAEIEKLAKARGKQWLRGKALSKSLFGAAKQ